MFMRSNRALNGADVSLGDHGDVAGTSGMPDHKAGRPSPFGNDGDLGSPEKLLFEPELSSVEAINRDYRTGFGAISEGTFGSDAHPYLDKVPVGTV